MSTTTEQSFTDPMSGRVVAGHGPRPFYVRSGVGGRSFGSLTAARTYARGLAANYSIFIDYAPGCGHFIEGTFA